MAGSKKGFEHSKITKKVPSERFLDFLEHDWLTTNVIRLKSEAAGIYSNHKSVKNHLNKLLVDGKIKYDRRGREEAARRIVSTYGLRRTTS